MDRKLEKLTKNTLIFALGSFGSKIVSFLLVPLYTHVLSTEGFGTADLAMSLSYLLYPIVSLSIGEAVLFFTLRQPKKKDAILQNSFVVVLFSAVFLFIAQPLIKKYQPIENYAWFVVFYTISTEVRVILQFYAKACEKNLLYSISSILNAICICSFNVLFLIVLKEGVDGYLFSYLFADFVVIIYLLIANRICWRGLFRGLDFSFLTQMVVFSMPLVLNSVSWSLAHTVDRIMTETFLSVAAVGIYSVASKIPTVVNTCVNFFNQAWTLSAITEYEGKDSKFYETAFSALSMVLFISVSIILLLIKKVMSVFVGGEFISAWEYVPVLLLAAIFQNYTSFFGAIIQSAKKNQLLLLTSVISGLTNIVANYILIPKLGIQGVVIGTLLSYLVGALLRLVFSRKIISFNIKLMRMGTAFLLLLLESIIVILELPGQSFIAFGIVIALLFLYRREFQTAIVYLSKNVKK